MQGFNLLHFIFIFIFYFFIFSTMHKLNKEQDKTYYHLLQDGKLPYVILNGFPFYRSWVKDKKYATINKEGKIIHFGHVDYEHYHDKIGLYWHLDHHDNKRRASFKARHEENINKEGTAAWFSDKYLW